MFISPFLEKRVYEEREARKYRVENESKITVKLFVEYK